MVLFEVPGWQVPVAGPSTLQNDRKRKRPSTAEDGSSTKVHSAEVNMDKLMKKLVHAEAHSSAKPKPPRGKDNKLKNGRGKRPASEEGPRNQSSKISQERHAGVKDGSEGREVMKKNKQKKERGEASPNAVGNRVGKSKPSPSSTDAVSQKQPQASQSLTDLQSKMKGKLEGARFRWINETLYKSESGDAEKLMQEDPQVFEEYHTGFRHQVTAWPKNPVDIFISKLSSYPERTVITDLGCGDASLARALIPKGFSILSYDLVSTNAFVTAADICDKLPLPGSETSEDGQVVDIVVCSLSLMSTNWPKCIREARRVLKEGGELKIAEVASRLTDVKKFVSLVNSIGFRLASKDESNTHFTLFEFRKTSGFPKFEDEMWQDILSRGNVLQPCEYKRR